jgi:hypothetical protein
MARRAMMANEDIERLREIQEEISNLVSEARTILRKYGGVTQTRAESYWVPHIMAALYKETEWLGGSMFTMEDTINELQGDEED